MTQSHLDVLQLFVDVQTSVVATYVETETSRSRGRYLRENTPWYRLIGPRRFLRKTEARLLQELKSKVWIVHGMLEQQIADTRLCMDSRSDSVVGWWKDRTRDLIKQIRSVELSYAPTVVWNLLWALDMLSDSPLHLTELNKADLL